MNTTGLKLWLLACLALPLGIVGGVQAQAVYIPPVTQSAQVVYASKAGAKMDTSLATGGGTDDTAALQAVLNKASTGRPVKLIMDGVALVTGLNLYSNTTIECLPGAGFYLKQFSNRAILWNVHKTSSTIIDHDITLIGGTYECNGSASGGSPDANGFLVGANPDANQLKWVQYDAAKPTLGGWTVGLGFYGVDGLTIRDATVLHPRNYCFQIGDATHLHMDNIHCDVGTTPIYNYDAIHLNGPIQWADLSNLFVRAGDDAVSICADDGQDPNSRVASNTNYGVPWLTNGSVSDVNVTGLHLENTLYGARLLSGNNRMDRMTVRGVTGTAIGYAVNANTFGLGPGNYGTINIDDVDVVEGTDTYQKAVINIGGIQDSLSLSNIRRNGSTNTKPTIDIDNTAHIKAMSIRGMSLVDTQPGGAGIKHITIEGAVQQLSVSDVNWLRLNGGTGPLIYNTGTVGDLGVSSYSGPASLVAGNTIASQHGDGFVAATVATNALLKSTFNVADATNLIGTYTPDVGGPWESFAGTWSIDGKVAHATGSLASQNWIAICRTTSPVTKTTTKFDLGAGQIQLWLRAQDISNVGTIVVLDSTGLVTVVGGTNNSIVSVGAVSGTVPPLAAGPHTAVVTITGNNYSMIVDGGSPVTWTSASVPSATGFGFGISGSTNPSCAFYTFEADK